MNMNAYNMKRCFTGIFLLVLLTAGCESEAQEDVSSDTDEMPRFEVVADWPQMLPNNWILGQVSGVAVDRRDHVWIVQRPSTLTPRQAGAAQDPPISLCCEPAPEVIEFAPDGSVVQAWGNQEDNSWFVQPHGIYIDAEDNVWVGGGWDEHHVIKFSREGEFLLQIGEKGQTEGSNSTEYLGGPTEIAVDVEGKEVFIADGYGNKRVVVFDSETGEYKRHWGAYGNVPHDEPRGRYSYSSGDEPSDQFRGPVHGIAISNDGLLYVTDRMNNRVQVFHKNGEFIDEVIIRPETLAMGSAWDVGFSEDQEQRWLYVPDGTNSTVWVVDRSTLELKGRFGHGGKNAGYFGWLHNLDSDSKGNLYTAEVEEGKRLQKFRKVQ